MLDRSVLVGKRPRESGGVRYAGFRVLRGGEEPRQHGTRTVVEKQPTAAPAYTVLPLRRSLAALGQSSLRRSSALTVFRMAMRRSNLPSTTPKFLIDPARNYTAGNVTEDTLRATLIEPRRRNNTGGRDTASSVSIVNRQSGDLSIRKLIVFYIREKIGRDTTNVANSTSLQLLVNACSKKLFNGTNITLLGSNRFPRKWRIKNKLTIIPDWSTENSFGNIVVSSRKCKRKCDDVGEIRRNLKFLAGVVKRTRSTLNHEVGHLVKRKAIDIVFVENTVDALTIVYPIDFISSGVRVATIAHAPRTCYASHAGGPTRTYGPPIAPQLDDRVSVTLDFHASAGLALPGTIPSRHFIRFRRFSAFLSSRVRISQTIDREIERTEFSRKSNRDRYELPTLPPFLRTWDVRVVWKHWENVQCRKFMEFFFR